MKVLSQRIVMRAISILEKPKLSLARRERVTFFARAKKVTKESTLCGFNGVFAEATSLCLRRTAHFLCAVGIAEDFGDKKRIRFVFWAKTVAKVLVGYNRTLVSRKSADIE